MISLYSVSPDSRVAASRFGSNAFFPASTISSRIFGWEPLAADALAIIRVCGVDDGFFDYRVTSFLCFQISNVPIVQCEICALSFSGLCHVHPRRCTQN